MTTTNAAADATQTPPRTGGCPRLRGMCRHAGRAKEVGLAGLTILATVGPKRARPYFQQLLAVISLIAATVQFFRNRKG